MIAGDKTAGAGSFAKRVAAAFPVDGRLSKHHGVVFWLRRPSTFDAAEAAFTEPPQQVAIAGGYQTAPGGFSSDRVDPGSQLLAQNLPPDLGGRVADFAAGWGFLALQVLERFGKLTALDLYEADHDSLLAARGNLDGTGTNVPLAFHWHDLRSEPVAQSYDAIVMNPPFHEGREANPEIGRQLIGAAASALRPGGQLILVANRHLPYEKTLAELFGENELIVEENGFKVLRSRRR